MYTSSRRGNAGHCQESSLLARVIGALEGCRVHLALSNGTRVSGTVAYYKRRLQTACVRDALRELHWLESSGPACLPPTGLRFASQGSENEPLSLPGQPRVARTPQSHIVLADATLHLAGRPLRASRVELHERWVSTLSPAAAEPSHAAPGGFSAQATQRAVHSSAQLRRLVLQQPSDQIKNAAFLRCSRIGQNNLK